MRSVPRQFAFMLALSSVLLSTGCMHIVPQYSAPLDNVFILKNVGNYSAKVGKFDDTKVDKNITVRAQKLISPYEKSYGEYLSEAVKQELTLAGKFNPSSPVEISGELIKNDFSSGLTKGKGDIQVRFIVTKEGVVRYDQVKSGHHEWRSSFNGADAVPLAQVEYPHFVQALLTQLYADQSFLDALQ